MPRPRTPVTALRPRDEQQQAIDAIVNMTVSQLQSEHSRRAYTKALDAFFEWFGRGKLFNWENVNEYRAYLQTQNLKAPTINLRIAAIRKLAETAWLAKLMDYADYQRLRKVAGVKADTTAKLGQWLTKDQCEKLLAQVTKQPKIGKLRKIRDRAILAIAMGCGLRRGEFTHLTVGHIRQVKNAWCIVDIVGKGEKTRTVPMGNWCYEIVKAWTDTFPDSRRNNPKTILFPPILCRRVFFDRPPMCDDNIYRIVRLYAEGAGLPLVTPHDLRRSFARLAEDNGAALREIQSSLGHSNIATTEIYLGSRQDFERSPGQLIHLDTEKGT